VAAAAAAVGAVAAEDGAAVAEENLEPIAIAIGQAWASEVVDSVRSAEREIVGGWPGTLREARARIRLELRSADLDVVDALARVAYGTARQHWQDLSEPDLEP